MNASVYFPFYFSHPAANPCPYNDQYSNCDSLAKISCGEPIGSVCPASCKCPTEIK